jgi:N-methylhydantoinase A
VAEFPTDWRLAVDIGGTFTDAVLLDATTGAVVVDKTLTTPAAPLDGVRAAVNQVLAKAGVRPAEITAPIVHATTLITNAIIEGKIGRAALVTTLGFGDTLAIRDEHRYDMYDLQIEFPAPPVPRSRIVELAERTSPAGEVVAAPTAADLDAVAEALRAEHVEAVGVCLINSYANPANERAVAEHVRRSLGVPVCVSAEISPQLREYPRMITTACNAATMPVIGPYLDELQKWLAAEGFGGAVLMMLSNGGVVSADDAARAPIRLVESGPAAGALAGSWFARRLGEPRLLCFDMGGTTAKSCLITGGEPELTNTFEVARIYRFKKGSGFPVSVPSVDLVEIGAGGGSEAWVDDLGLLKVGPESAGADPGPACYGRGGTAPTVTDADVTLGLLDPGYFLGGDMPLDLAAAEAALASIAHRLGLPGDETSVGVIDLVNQNMAASSRMHAVEQGADLRGVTVLAFGGAGPVHACGVAELLESSRVVFPMHASVLSAFGTLVSPVRIDLARSMVRPLAAVDGAERDALLDELRDEGRRVLAAAGVRPEHIRFRYGVDARYLGQGNEITVWVGEGDGWPASDDDVRARFEDDYRRIYGLTIPDVGIEAVTWRLSAYSIVDAVEPVARIGDAPGAPIGTRPVKFTRGQSAVATAVYRREHLGAGQQIDGPAIVEERETTAVIRPGWRATLAADGSLTAERRGRAAESATTRAEGSASDVHARAEGRASVVDARAEGRASDEAQSSERVSSERDHQLDPIELEVLWQSLIATVNEQARALQRAAFSPIVREAGDLANAVFDRRGRMVAQAVTGTPGHINSLARAASAILAEYPPDTIAEGDVLITNDPYQTAGQLLDVTVLYPVFRAGRVTAFFGSTIHHTDVGGYGIGAGARDVFEEGLWIPICKLMRGGQRNDDVWKFILSNVRQPDHMAGDLHAQMASGEVGAQRLRTLCDTHGLDDIEALADEVIERSEAATRASIGELPAGTHRAQAELDLADGSRIYIACAITVDPDAGEILVDYEGSSDASPYGINVVRNYTHAYTTFTVRSVLNPELPNNHGSLAPIKVAAPVGSIVHAVSPQPCTARHVVGMFLPNALLKALAQIRPEAAMAEGSGAVWTMQVSGHDDDGRPFITAMFTYAGGVGARYAKPGLDACSYPTGVAAVPVEVVEASAPIRFLRKSLRPGSGGAGAQSGGLGQTIEFTVDTTRPWQLNAVTSRLAVAPEGIFGGEPGAPGSFTVNGEAVRTQSRITLQPGDHVRLELPGGGGYGAPS